MLEDKSRGNKIAQVCVGIALCGFSLFLVKESTQSFDYDATSNHYSSRPVTKTVRNPSFFPLLVCALLAGGFGLYQIWQGLHYLLADLDKSDRNWPVLEERDAPVDFDSTSSLSGELAATNYRKNVLFRSSPDGEVTFSSTTEKKSISPNAELLSRAAFFNDCRTAHHFFINGPTGNGKSSLSQELVSFLASEFSMSYTAIIDPKYIKKNYAWGDAVPLISSIDDALAGLQILNDFMNNRKQNPEFETGDYDNYPPMFCVVEEIDWIIAHHKGAALEAFRNLIKVGRALHIIVVAIGQSALLKATGLDSSDVGQCSRFILGPEAVRFLNNSQNVHPDLKKYRSVMQKFQADNQRFALVFPTQGKPFLSRIRQITGTEFNSLIHNNPETGSSIALITEEDHFQQILDEESSHAESNRKSNRDSGD